MLQEAIPEDRESTVALRHRLDEAAETMRGEPHRAERRPATGTIVGLTALALAVGMGVYMGADFIRYLKIRRM